MAFFWILDVVCYVQARASVHLLTLHTQLTVLTMLTMLGLHVLPKVEANRLRGRYRKFQSSNDMMGTADLLCPDSSLRQIADYAHQS